MPRVRYRKGWSLGVLLLPAALVSMDISILFVAGPSITADLEPNASQYLWMMDVYSFVLAGLLITMGSLGDLIGRRLLLLIGAGMFGLASIALVLAPTPELFIAGRALLAVGAATLAPSTLALVRVVFTDQCERRTAIAAWNVAFTGGAIAGPVLGGVLLEFFGWGSVFLINVPVMVLLMATAPFLVPESRNPTAAGFDPIGAGLTLVAILALVFATKHVVDNGPDLLTVAAAVTAAGLTVLFVRHLRTARQPLIEPSLLRHRELATGALIGLVASLVMVGTGLLAFTFLQTVHGLTPLVAALAALPTVAGTALGAASVGRSVARTPPSTVVARGSLVGAAGMIVIALLDAATAPAVFVTGYTILTAGMGAVSTVAAVLVLDGAPVGRAGSAASVSETGIALGDALGIAMFGTISAFVYREAMRVTPAPSAAIDSVGGAVRSAEQGVPGATAALPEAFEAFTTSLNVVAAVGAGLLCLTALLVKLTSRAGRNVPGRPPPPRPAPAG